MFIPSVIIRRAEGENPTGSEATPPAEPAATPPAPPVPSPPPVPAQPPAPAAPGAPEPPAGASADEGSSFDDLPEREQKAIKDLRRENQQLRAGRTQAEQAAAAAQEELVQNIGKALGLVKDETPDPEALVAAATQREQEMTARARQAELQLAVLSNAPSKQAADLLLDSRAFMEKVAALDPAAADFASQVGAAISEAVAQNPARFATQAPVAPANTGGSTHQGEAPKDTDSIEAMRKSYAENRSLRP